MDNDITPEAIIQRLNTRFIGRTIVYHPSVSSTMDAAKEEAASGATEGTVVVAREQTCGKGRLGREWINPPGVIAFSILLRPEMNNLLRLTMVASLATSRAIDTITGLSTSIKWPNDVLLNGRKVSGILTQSAFRKRVVDWAIIGIGINVNFDPTKYEAISESATSLSNELGREVSQLDVIAQVLNEFEMCYLALCNGEPIHEQWQARLETLGKVVRIKAAKHILEGLAESVDDDGALLLRQNDGKLLQITAGDVTLRV